jgi:hypothetical protein
MVKKLKLTIAFLLLSLAGFSQNIISYVTVNTNDAYIGEPVQLIVSVYTSTWFTSGIDLGNIKVDGALTVFFRSVSNTKQFSGKNHAGVNFYYNVFPTDEGTITIPSLSINIESPKPGGYKGIKRTVKTKPKSFNVKAIPFGYDPNQWLVASSLNIREKWSVQLNDIKVGDVIQRTINRSAGGTLSEFIPATIWDSIPGVSLYPKRASVTTNKSKTGVSSTRTETVNYLFEKEGQVVIPSRDYVYWNSRTKKFYKKQLDSITIAVKPNADLQMLASIKKSLQQANTEELEVEEKPFLVFGMTPKEVLKYLIFSILGFYVLFRISKRTIKFYKKRHKAYLESEPYVFKKVKKAIENKDMILFSNACNSWLLKLGAKDMNLQKFIKTYGTKKLTIIIDQMNEATYKEHKTIDKMSFTLLLRELKKARKDFFKRQKQPDNSKQINRTWLNPTVVD